MTFDEMSSERSSAVYADFLVRHLTEEHDLLDVGCGAGTITIGLAPKVRHVIGVDSDVRTFMDAQKHVSDLGIQNVEFRKGNTYCLEFDDE